jgi:F-type H+-transporting ATPase subunit delta
MKNLVIARRYAKALLLIGKEDGQAEAYKEELAGWPGCLADQPELEQADLQPAVQCRGPQEGAQGARSRSWHCRRSCHPFCCCCSKRGASAFWGTSDDFYQKLADELKGIARASLVSATSCSSETVDKIRAIPVQKNRQRDHSGYEQDPSLIGGIVTRIGDLVLDGSIKTQLLNMRETLKRGESV